MQSGWQAPQGGGQESCKRGSCLILLICLRRQLYNEFLYKNLRKGKYLEFAPELILCIKGSHKFHIFPARSAAIFFTHITRGMPIQIIPRIIRGMPIQMIPRIIRGTTSGQPLDNPITSISHLSRAHNTATTGTAGMAECRIRK